MEIRFDTTRQSKDEFCFEALDAQNTTENVQDKRKTT